MTKSQFVALVNKTIEARNLSIHDLSIGSYTISAQELDSMRAKNSAMGNTGCYTESSIIKFAAQLHGNGYIFDLSRHQSDAAMQAIIIKFTRWLDEMKAAQPLSDVKELDSTVSDMAKEIRLKAEMAIAKAEKRLNSGTDGYVIVTPDCTCSYNHKVSSLDASHWVVYMVDISDAPALTSLDARKLCPIYSRIRGGQPLIEVRLAFALNQFIHVQENILKALSEQGY
ncbi:hypothetical protein [Pectobacterium phage Wc4-1]|uniref:Uncharacterized protein n=1 Tax=Pectobacterium phage Wc4 TaxID=2652428 RepID=A0A5P8D3Y1_9CAUD|nr:hypothetical protein [Pectobacterium phage Wc4]QFP93912.1 hypothetical protein [Pectobacterium phage Wc4-1]